MVKKPDPELATLRACGVSPMLLDGIERELFPALLRICSSMSPRQVRYLLDGVGHVLLYVAALPPKAPLDVEALPPWLAPTRKHLVEKSRLVHALLNFVGERFPQSNAAGVAAVLCWRLADRSDPESVADDDL